MSKAINPVDYTITIRQLRGYYNEVADLINADPSTLEDDLIKLDKKWAASIVKDLTPLRTPVSKRINMYTEGFKAGYEKGQNDLR